MKEKDMGSRRQDPAKRDAKRKPRSTVAVLQAQAAARMDCCRRAASRREFSGAVVRTDSTMQRK